MLHVTVYIFLFVLLVKTTNGNCMIDNVRCIAGSEEDCPQGKNLIMTRRMIAVFIDRPFNT